MSNFNELFAILAHEEKTDCKNIVIIGGIESFVNNWADRIRTPENANAINQICNALKDYATASPSQRHLMIHQAVIKARQVESKTQTLEPPPGLGEFGRSQTNDQRFRQESQPIFDNSTSARKTIRENYKLRYKGGHKGLDYYLATYMRKDQIEGILSLTRDGVQFRSTETKSERKFNLGWSEITSADYDNEGLMFVKTILRIYTPKHYRLKFETDEAAKISANINRMIRLHISEQERKEQLEKASIQSRRLDEISPQRFEDFIGELFKAMDYQVRRVGRVGDEGIDLICKDPDGNLVVIQCKRYSGIVGGPLVREFYGALMHRKAKMGVLITTGEFSEPARRFALGKPIVLVDRERLAILLDKYLKQNVPTG